MVPLSTVDFFGRRPFPGQLAASLALRDYKLFPTTPIQPLGHKAQPHLPCFLLQGYLCQHEPAGKAPRRREFDKFKRLMTLCMCPLRIDKLFIGLYIRLVPLCPKDARKPKAVRSTTPRLYSLSFTHNIYLIILIGCICFAFLHCKCVATVVPFV